MTSLQETLSALSIALPPLSERVHGVVEDGQELERAASAALDECRQKQGQAAELFARVQEALEEHREHAEQQQEGLQSALSRLDREVEALDALAQTEQQASEEAGEVAAAMSELQSRLASESADLEVAHTRLLAAIGHVVQTAHERQAALEKSMPSLTSAAESLRDTADDARAVLADQVQAMAEAARQGKAVLEQVMDQMASDVLPGLVSQLEASLQETRGTLEDALQEIAARWRARLEDEIKCLTEAAVGDVKQAFLRRDAVAQQLTEAWSGTQGAFTDAASEVEELLTPLEGGVEAVKEAAARVGLEW